MSTQRGYLLIIACGPLLILSLLGSAAAAPPPEATSAWRPLFLPLLARSREATATSTATVTRSATATRTATTTPTGTRSATPVRGDVRIAPECSQVDAPGNDNDNLTEEYICLENRGAMAADLAGWRVRDAAGAEYTFPGFILASLGRARLRTGSGTDTATDLYWGRGSAVWNNDHDTAYLFDATGRLMDEWGY